MSCSTFKSAQLIKGTSDFTVMTPGGLEIWTLSPTPRAEKPTITLLKMDCDQEEQGPGLLSWLLGKGQGMTGEEFDNLGLYMDFSVATVLTTYSRWTESSPRQSGGLDFDSKGARANSARAGGARANGTRANSARASSA
jgi:hypothetical protein